MNDDTLEKLARETAGKLKIGWWDGTMTRWDCVPAELIATALRQVRDATRASALEEFGLTEPKPLGNLEK